MKAKQVLRLRVTVVMQSPNRYLVKDNDGNIYSWVYNGKSLNVSLGDDLSIPIKQLTKESEI